MCFSPTTAIGIGSEAFGLVNGNKQKKRARAFAREGAALNELGFDLRNEQLVSQFAETEVQNTINDARSRSLVSTSSSERGVNSTRRLQVIDNDNERRANFREDQFGFNQRGISLDRDRNDLSLRRDLDANRSTSFLEAAFGNLGLIQSAFGV